MFRFTFRELVLALAFAAMATAWAIDRLNMRDALESARARAAIVQQTATHDH